MTVIPVLIILTSLVGPPGAVLMIPRPGLPTSLMSNSSELAHFPLHVSSIHGMSLYGPL